MSFSAYATYFMFHFWGYFCELPHMCVVSHLTVSFTSAFSSVRQSAMHHSHEQKAPGATVQRRSLEKQPGLMTASSKCASYVKFSMATCSEPLTLWLRSFQHERIGGLPRPARRRKQRSRNSHFHATLCNVVTRPTHHTLSFSTPTLRKMVIICW